MKKMENNLDERQEQVLLKIEHNGCWLAFWGLLAAIVVQSVVFGLDMKVLAGEWVVYLVLCLYLAIDCLRNGIWDRRLKANASTNLWASAAAGVFLAILNFVVFYRRFSDSVKPALGAALFSGILGFVLCMIALTIATAAYKKKHEALEEEDE